MSKAKKRKRNPPSFVRRSIYGRLVGASSNVIGRELLLTGPLMTIGRDSSNDLIIRNVGVSREQAKIREEPESGQFTISDLQSTNGVRINGRAYGKVQLRDGDYVDFGQVRFRFVGPGKDFVFARDVKVTIVSRAARKKRARTGAVRRRSNAGVPIRKHKRSVAKTAKAPGLR